MAILAFQKPDKVLMLEADAKFGKFEFRPLEPGFGITVGNALRRILLSSLEGFAITTIKIEGVEHEFSNVPGVKEDVTNIILNLKQVRFKQVVEEFESEKVSIIVENSSEFKAGDIGKYLTGFEVLNPELVICHLDSKATMQLDITINKGRGYVPADENREYCTDVNVIPIDSIYTPIRNVKYQIEPFRVEQKTDYDKLVLEVTTDGSIHPKDALKEAAKILIHHFMLFSDEKITLETTDADSNEEFDEEVLHMRQLLKTRLVDMDLSVRALNCLKAADVDTKLSFCRYWKGLALQKLGRKEEAKAIYEALVAEGKAAVVEDIVSFYGAEGTSSLTVEGINTMAYRMMAFGYLGLGNSDAAKECFELALQLKNDNLWAKFMLENF